MRLLLEITRARWALSVITSRTMIFAGRDAACLMSRTSPARRERAEKSSFLLPFPRLNLYVWQEAPFRERIRVPLMITCLLAHWWYWSPSLETLDSSRFLLCLAKSYTRGCSLFFQEIFDSLIRRIKAGGPDSSTTCFFLQLDSPVCRRKPHHTTWMIKIFNRFFLFHPKDDYKLSLCITFSNIFDNLWKSWRLYDWRLLYKIT